jgi:acetyl esterase/lipase
MLNTPSLMFVLAASVWLTSAAVRTGSAEGQRLPGPGQPSPDLRDEPYGHHERNVLDLWKAKSDKPTPLVVFIHGGGFRGGDKGGVPLPLLRGSLAAGFSVASINYRLSDTAPFPAPMLDGARAIQFLRSKATEWNLNPAKIAATGGSAGAGISLWVGFHDDLAKPDSADPVERQSSRLACVGPFNAQTSYDPRFIRKHIGGNDISHTALLAFYGLRREEFDTPKAHKLFQEASPINYLTKDDPPVFIFYPGDSPPVPLPAEASENAVIHHSQFGVVLRQEMEALGIRCQLWLGKDHDGDPGGRQAAGFADMVTFFAECFERP